MSLPLTEGDTTCERFLPAVPADFQELALACKAFRRARKIKSPAQLLRVVMTYCGLDQALRVTAGAFTLGHERISDTAIHKRLAACGPWVKALLSRLIATAAEPLRVSHRRWVVVDGSTVQGPGATGTWYRLHLAVDVARLQMLFVKVTDAHAAESLAHYPLQTGDVVIADRGYNQTRAWLASAAQGVDLVVRYNPPGLTLCTATGAKIDWLRELQAMTVNARCFPVRAMVAGQVLRGYVHACRLPPAAGGGGAPARAGQRHQERSVGAAARRRVGRVGADLHHLVPAAPADDHLGRALSGPVASGIGD